MAKKGQSEEPIGNPSLGGYGVGWPGVGAGLQGQGGRGGSKLWLGAKFVIWRAVQGKGEQVGEEGVGWGRGQQLKVQTPSPPTPRAWIQQL